MVQKDRLRELIGTMLMLPADSVESRTSLASLDNSLGEAKLRLGVKRLGLHFQPRIRPATFGELCDLLSEKPNPSVSEAAPSSPVSVVDAAFAGLRVGLDLQDISSLPAAADYWEDPFYSGIFGKSEIAYAVMHSEPRTHFAGFWCAKEALRKCDPSFAKVDPAATTVAHEGGGRPYLVWSASQGQTRLPHALSISHAAAIAMAVVVVGWPGPPTG